MTRPLALALVLSIASMLAVAPGAEAKKRVRHSHVPACAALVGAPCQAALDNWRPSVAWLHFLKEMNKWH